MMKLNVMARRFALLGKTKTIAIAAVIAATLAAWAAIDGVSAPARPMAGWMPSGAQLYIESPDFAGLLHNWNQSQDKRLWLKSDNYDVFSRSRLFGRLGDAQGEFAGAAGQRPDMEFLNQIAGKQSGLAIYDIGKLEFLYITHMPNAAATQTALMRSRNDFESRKAGDAVFYLRSSGGAEQGSGPGRTVAFAVSGDYLLLATREDLLADALTLMQNQNQKQRSLNQDGWFADVTRTLSQPGDLRMVLDLSRLVPSPYFRSYWVQQNVTDMGQYRSAASDLYLTHGEFHEERVLLPKSAENAGVEQSDLGELKTLVPDGAGFYRAESAPGVDRILESIDTRLLSRKQMDYSDRTVAPVEVEAATQAGGEGDFETSIDAPPIAAVPKAAALGSLRNLLEAEQPATMLIVEKTASQADGVFIGYHSAVALESQKPWSASEVEDAIGLALASQMTAGKLGIEWKQAPGEAGYFALDGLDPLSFAIEGRYLMMSDDAEMLSAMMQRPRAAKHAPGKALVLLSGFNHGAERANFASAAHLMDGAGNSANKEADGDGSGGAPQFLSRNVASLSSAFAAMQSEEVSEYWKGGAMHQTVRYEWK